MKKILTLFAIAILTTAFMNLPLFAKEPTNILVGFGIGAGQSKLSMEHSRVMQYPPMFDITTPGTVWRQHQNQYLDSWALAWEFMVGYKHFINNYVGFRYYGNIGIQHYKPVSFSSNKQEIGFVDYALNMDLLINFWENKLLSVGILGGLGFGGTSFDKKAITKYMAVYRGNNPSIPVGLADVQKHFLNVNASVGARLTFFQKMRRTSAKMCDKIIKGKRTCRVPTFYIGHSVEFNAKFPLLPYRATERPDVIVLGNKVQDGAISRPGYTVSNPYRLTIRYVVDF